MSKYTTLPFFYQTMLRFLNLLIGNKHIYLFYECLHLLKFLLNFKLKFKKNLHKVFKIQYNILCNYRNTTNFYALNKKINMTELFLLMGNMSAGISKLKLTYYNQSFKWFYLLNSCVSKHFAVVLNVKKLFKVFILFKQIVFGLGFYSFKIFAFGTPEFQAEVDAINKIYTMYSLNKFYFNYFHKQHFFTDKIPYNVEVDTVMTRIAFEAKCRDFYIVVQEKALASFFVSKVNSCAVGFFTYTPQKHSYSFLVPIFIENFYMKTAMYGYIFNNWCGGKKLKFFNFYIYIFNFKMYKLFMINFK